jgi:hypothetical protein
LQIARGMICDRGASPVVFAVPLRGAGADARVQRRRIFRRATVVLSWRYRFFSNHGAAMLLRLNSRRCVIRLASTIIAAGGAGRGRLRSGEIKRRKLDPRTSIRPDFDQARSTVPKSAKRFSDDIML